MDINHYCPRCGVEVTDLAKWKADGYMHDGCFGVCAAPPGCNRHWEERNRELVRQVEELTRAKETLIALTGCARQLIENDGAGARYNAFLAGEARDQVRALVYYAVPEILGVDSERPAETEFAESEQREHASAEEARFELRRVGRDLDRATRALSAMLARLEKAEAVAQLVAEAQCCEGDDAKWTDHAKAALAAWRATRGVTDGE